MRDLTHDRTKLVQERSSEVNRVQGVLERANIKLASVATDIMGVSGLAMLAALLDGQAEAAVMAELAKGRLRTNLPLLAQALTGLTRNHHRRLLARPLAHIDVLDEQMTFLNADIARSLMTLDPREPPTPAAEEELDGNPSASGTVTSPWSFARAVSVLDTIPGVDQRRAELLVAEWGTDMGRFGTAARLAAWTGVAPGNDKSAGKRRSGNTRQGHRALRTGLTQTAVCPENLERFTGLTFSAIVLTLDERTSAPADVLW